ncbi:MAG TPA: hypothetical protein DCG75_04585 [Bacteroidales bacterium]|nr:hypothetical protein [Bacteroidales bacterium]
MNYTNLLKINISAIIVLTLSAILIIGITITERKFIKIQFRYFFKQKKLIYLSLIHFFNRSKEKNNQIIKKFLIQKSGFVIATLFRNKIGYEYWQNVYESYPEILLIAVEKNTDTSTIIQYFDELQSGTLKSYLNPNIKRQLASQIIAKGITWCKPNERNHQDASRLGSLAIEMKIFLPKNDTELANKECWNNLLLPFIQKKLNTKYIYKSPFFTGTENFKPKAVYRSGVKIYRFFKEIDFEDGARHVFDKLNQNKFKKHFSQIDFS